MHEFKKRLYPENYLEIAATAITKNHTVTGLMLMLWLAFNALNQKCIDKQLRPLNLEQEPFSYIKQRYPNVFTLKQAEFDGFPAAIVPILGSDNCAFDVISEGPYAFTMELLLSHLKKLQVSVLIPVGNAKEIEKGQEKDKYFDYMQISTPVSCAEFIRHTTTYVGSLPTDIDTTNFKFFKFHSKDSGDFWVMFVPNWGDHGMPKFSNIDKWLLAVFFAHGKSACYHCSAGIGRSPALLMMKMAYLEIFLKNNYLNLNEQELCDKFIKIIERIKYVKPGAGEIHQVLTVLGLAEDARLLYSPNLSIAAIPPIASVKTTSPTVTPAAMSATLANGITSSEHKDSATTPPDPKISEITTPHVLSFSPKPAAVNHAADSRAQSTNNPSQSNDPLAYK